MPVSTILKGRNYSFLFISYLYLMFINYNKILK